MKQVEGLAPDGMTSHEEASTNRNRRRPLTDATHPVQGMLIVSSARSLSPSLA
jgi:hypothetical protein